jgi:hypothetical protein
MRSQARAARNKDPEHQSLRDGGFLFFAGRENDRPQYINSSGSYESAAHRAAHRHAHCTGILIKIKAMRAPTTRSHASNCRAARFRAGRRQAARKPSLLALTVRDGRHPARCPENLALLEALKSMPSQ